MSIYTCQLAWSFILIIRFGLIRYALMALAVTILSDALSFAMVYSFQIPLNLALCTRHSNIAQQSHQKRIATSFLVVGYIT